ncbi:ABC transporter ATP-binding protein [Bacillus sp. M6-12]|uniref:ABC transporter ATP-binding protein n=1 Tax=Bacillus sp. M6-12 TaxID=2054166 RepID=UPI000C7638C9|nr:ABC transporter ATP-binding protein [Bacillus sp. M6-12]PLS14901.1 ABC transporter ATP-binding protein [Bacillus sp. M6-12]
MNLLEIKIDQAGYESGKPVINDLKFDLKPGEMVGVIGPNGAGKSTTIKTILGLIENWKGTVAFSENSRYSYIPERPIFYDELTFKEHIDFIGAVEGIEDSILEARAAEYLKTFKMEDHIHELMTTYSKGMQQKALLILAFITQPEVYIIDEPFIGLDPDAMKILLSFLKKEQERGAGILMSTHVLDTAERVCDRFIMIKNGQLKANGTLTEIREQCSMPEATLYECYHSIAGEP